MILTTQDYMAYVYSAGALPVLVSPLDNDNYLLDIVKNTDMLLLSGGEDSAPELYGQKADKNLGTVVKERDIFEMKLVSLFLDARKPVFGICRGFQLLNIYFKGTLHQDYRLLNKDFSYHCEQPYQKLIHKVELSPYLEMIYRTKEIKVNSHHHQFIDRLGENLEIIAVAKDGIIEAFKNDNKKILAVQWHPEMLYGKYQGHLKLLNNFIEKYKVK